MQGTGTQNDPYIPENGWSDFVTAVGTYNAYVSLPKVLQKTTDTSIDNEHLYFLEDGTIVNEPQQSQLSNYYVNTFKYNMNEIAPMGVSDIKVNCKYLYGNDVVIEHLYCPNDKTFVLGDYQTYTSPTSYINNLHFMDFKIDKTLMGTKENAGYSENWLWQIEQCRFNGISYGTDSSAGIFEVTYSNNPPYPPNLRFYPGKKGCSFNIKAPNGIALFSDHHNGTYPTDSAWQNIYHLSYANVHFDGVNFVSTQGTYTKTFGTRAYNSFIGGNCTNFQNSNSNQFAYCVIDMETDEATSINSNSSICLVNSDKAPNAIAHDSTTKLVTTEQLYDASYLNSIGFPIGVD